MKRHAHSVYIPPEKSFAIDKIRMILVVQASLRQGHRSASSRWLLDVVDVVLSASISRVHVVVDGIIACIPNGEEH